MLEPLFPFLFKQLITTEHIHWVCLSVQLCHGCYRIDYWSVFKSKL